MQTAQGLFKKAFPESPAPLSWILNGGKLHSKAQALPRQGDILYTGHTDGRVRVWAAGSVVPELRGTVPFDSGGAGAKLRPVSVIEVSLLGL